MVRLLQWYEPFKGEIDRDALEETVSLMLDELKEKFTVTKTEELNLNVLDIEFCTQPYFLDSDLGSVQFSRVSAAHTCEYEGSQRKFGVGLDGMGALVQTVRIDGERDLVEDVEMDIEAAFGDYGAGLTKGSVDEFLQVVDAAKRKGKTLVGLSDYVHCALRLEASKGPFMDTDRYESLRARYIDSLSDEFRSEGVLAEIRDTYEIIKGQCTVLKRKIDALKNKH